MARLSWPRFSSAVLSGMATPRAARVTHFCFLCSSMDGGLRDFFGDIPTSNSKELTLNKDVLLLLLLYARRGQRVFAEQGKIPLGVIAISILQPPGGVPSHHLASTLKVEGRLYIFAMKLKIMSKRTNKSYLSDHSKMFFKRHLSLKTFFFLNLAEVSFSGSI